jgi:hypothetical protein
VVDRLNLILTSNLVSYPELTWQQLPGMGFADVQLVDRCWLVNFLIHSHVQDNTYTRIYIQNRHCTWCFYAEINNRYSRNRNTIYLHLSLLLLPVQVPWTCLLRRTAMVKINLIRVLSYAMFTIIQSSRSSESSWPVTWDFILSWHGSSSTEGDLLMTFS